MRRLESAISSGLGGSSQHQSTKPIYSLRREPEMVATWRVSGRRLSLRRGHQGMGRFCSVGIGPHRCFRRGGGVPGGGKYLIVVAALVTLVYTIVVMTGRSTYQPLSETVDPQEFEIRRSDEDNRIVDQITQTEWPRTIEWLRNETFEGTWRDARVEPLRTPWQPAIAARATFPDEFGAALAAIVGATADFLRFYERHTRVDDLLLEGDWRELDVAETSGGGSRESSAHRRYAPRWST